MAEGAKDTPKQGASPKSQAKRPSWTLRQGPVRSTTSDRTEASTSSHGPLADYRSAQPRGDRADGVEASVQRQADGSVQRDEDEEPGPVPEGIQTWTSKGVASATWPANMAGKWQNNRLEAPFTNTIYFSADGGGSYAYAEYRQYVKGAFKANGTALVHNLGAAGNLDATYREDGPGQYGHRAAGPNSAKDKYTVPNRATGKKYYMEDEPGIGGGPPGTRLEMDLQFKGVVIDTSAGNAILEEKRWTVKGRKKI